MKDRKRLPEWLHWRHWDNASRPGRLVRQGSRAIYHRPAHTAPRRFDSGLTLRGAQRSLCLPSPLASSRGLGYGAVQGARPPSKQRSLGKRATTFLSAAGTIDGLMAARGVAAVGQMFAASTSKAITGTEKQAHN